MNIKQEIDLMLNPKSNKDVSTIIKQGIDNGVYYYVKSSTKRYIIQNTDDYKNKIAIEVLNSKLPKFGKYEIEEFFESRFLTALLIKRDMTDIFNTTVYYNDFPRATYFKAEKVKEIFMKETFEVVKEEKNIVYIALK